MGSRARHCGHPIAKMAREAKNVVRLPTALVAPANDIVPCAARRPRPEGKREAIAEPTVRLGGMVAASPLMHRVFAKVKRVARSDAPVLITGPSGCGKELVARAVHAESSRRDAPFVAINCGALRSGLIEGELFGHTKGAFTGAIAAKAGAFEAADGGTIFLDEIGELPLEMQPTLLRVLESSAVRRVGGTNEIPVNTRVVAATHRNLAELVARGEFREDLYHRLFVLTVGVPALAERPEDVLPLARHFLSTLASDDEAPRLSPGAEATLLDHPWPGNVRELKNVIIRADVARDEQTITPADLELGTTAPTYCPPSPAVAPVTPCAPAPAPAPEAFELDSYDPEDTPEAERDRLIAVLKACGNNRSRAARTLGIAKTTFHDRLRRAGVPHKFQGRPARA